MVENIFYQNARDKIVDFINHEWPDFPQGLLNQYLNFFTTISHYEEEGVSIKPNILLTNDIDAIDRAISLSYTLEMFSDDTEAKFISRMKALAPFCLHDWNVYVCAGADGKFRYGIYRCLNSIKDKDFNTQLFEKKSLKERTDKIFAFLTSAYTSSCIIIKGLKDDEVRINFGLTTKKVLDYKEEIQEFVDASFSKLRTTKQKLSVVKTLYGNIFENVFKNVHGTICVVIDKDYEDDGYLGDGIWLSEPISFSKLFTQAKSASEAKLLGISNLFLNMLNYDGITVVDNMGRIRAYNVFVETEQQDFNIYGGARKRAVFSIINSKKKKIVGVYFKSQEGEVFYQRVRR